MSVTTITGRAAGKVALVTGAARGMGRSHAVRLAEEGADIIALDISRQIDTNPVPMSTRHDLDETVHAIEARGRQVVAFETDVRDLGAVQDALAKGGASLGRLDIVSANAGIGGFATIADMSGREWPHR